MSMWCCSWCQSTHLGEPADRWGDGQGHRLGGDTGGVTAEQRRELQQKASEARRKEWDARAGKKGSSSSSSASSSSRNNDGKAAPMQQETFNRTVDNSQDKQAALAKAAEKRVKENTGGLSAEKHEELKLKRQKDDLIGKIVHLYRMAGQDEPFGLAACSLDALKKQYEFAKTLQSGGGSIQKT